MSNRKYMRNWLFDNEDGYTTVGFAIAILLVCALLFCSVRICRINSASNDIQYVADAAAIAAEDTICEYIVVARICDALVLSLSLTGLTLYGTSAVVACVPGVNAAASSIANIASKVMKVRDSFSRKAKTVLKELQKVLPTVAAYSAAKVASAQTATFSEGDHSYYIGFALLNPTDGDGTVRSSSSTKEEETEIKQNTEEVSKETSTLANETRKCNEALYKGYYADCGAYTSSTASMSAYGEGMCLYERAKTLAGLSSASNPYYSSSSSWSFAVPLARAKAYYQARIANETPEGTSLEEQVKSFARKKFYKYALEQVKTSTITYEEGEVVAAHLASLPKNTNDVKETKLFTEAIYPLSVNESGQTVLHYSTDCPACTSVTGYGALNGVAGHGSGKYCVCEECNFSITSLGKVPAASTSISNGFEHYWRTIVEAAEAYTSAKEATKEAESKQKQKTQSSIDAFAEALEKIAADRYSPSPPGRYGCIVFVIDAQSHETSDAGSSFVAAGDTKVGPRVAISAARMVDGEEEYGSSILEKITKSLVSSEGSSSSLFSMRTILGKIGTLWGDILVAYSKGSSALEKAAEKVLTKITGSSSVGTYAKKSLQAVIKGLGLEPAKIGVPRAITVNSAHVLAQSDDFLVALSNARKTYTSVPGDYVYGTSSIESIADALEKGLRDSIVSNVTVDLLSFTGIEGLSGLPITIKLPSSLTSKTNELITRVRSRFDELVSTLPSNNEVWQ